MSFCDDEFWDYQRIWNTTDPDLPQCFQDTILVYAPCLFLWLVGPVLLVHQWKKPTVVHCWTLPAIVKTVIAAFLVFLSVIGVTYLIYESVTYGAVLPSSLYLAFLLKLVTFVLSIVITNMDRLKGVGSSGYQFTFWFLLVVCGSVQFRTYFLQALEFKILDPCIFGYHMIYYPLVMLEFVMFCFVDREANPVDKYRKKVWPEYRSSFPSRLLFSWYTRLVYKGWKRPLTADDLWQLESKDTTENTSNEFSRKWKEEVDRAELKSKPPSLFRALMRTHFRLMILTGFLQLITTVILQTVLLPYALRYIVSFVSSTNEFTWKGYVVSVVLFLISSGFSIFLAQFYHVGSIVSLRMRSALMGAIYRKALRISPHARQEKSSAEIVNLMAVDAQRFIFTPIHIHSLWGCTLQLIIAITMLYQVIGPAVFSGVGAMLLTVPLVGVVMRKNRAVEAVQLEEKDRRMKIMNEILNGIKILKLYAWEPAFEENVKDIRDREIAALKRSAHLKAINMITWLFTPSLIAVFSFMTFVMASEENRLTPATAFVSLALFGILRVPLALLPAAITGLIQAKLSLNRISTFLLTEETKKDSVQRFPKDSAVPYAVAVEDASFTWDQESDSHSLRNVNFAVSSGELVVVVGPTGSGKSTLCSALLGMIQKLSGDVSVKGDVAYCSQTAWIQNLTLRDNILFGKPFDENKYWRVIEAAALLPDLQILPAGDRTLIGEKGINLSGGQKQRVALARAIYCGADVYVLDDSLSAVDPSVASHIIENVIGPKGLLKDKTRVVVTNSTTLLPYADKILFIRDGTVKAFAPLSEMMGRSDFTMFHQDLQAHVNSQQISIDTPRKPVKRSASPNGSLHNQHGNGVDTTDGAVIELKSLKNGKGSEETKKLIEDQHTDEEHAESGTVSWKVYKTLLTYASYKGVAVVFFTNAVYTAFVLAANIWLSLWSESEKQREINERDDRGYWLGLYVLFNVLQAISIYVSALVLSLICLVASKKIHNEMLKRLMRAPMVFFETTPGGRILNRFSKDLDNLDNQLPVHFKMWINGLFILLSVLILICISTPIFAAAVPVIALLYFFVQKAFIPSSRQIKRLEAVTRSPIFSHFQESLSGRAVILAMNQEERFIELNDELNDLHNMASYANNVGQRWLLVRVETIASICTFLAAFFAVFGKDHWSVVHPGLVGLAITYATTMSSSFSWMVQRSSEIEANVVSVERMQEYTRIEQEADWEKTADKYLGSWPDSGDVQFSDYGLKYRGGSELILENINCRIVGGEKIGVCGRTGAGKSSLISALFRLIEASEGSITIDGMDIGRIGLHSLRSKLTIIPQDPVLFAGTIRSNLDPYNGHEDSKLWKALEDSHLKELVESGTEGLEMKIVEGGENLSVGQRQLVCLARALLRRTKILILDEATASVDLESDALIQKTIRRDFAECTVITVAHRLSTIMDYDRVMVLEGGRIVELGSPSALLSNRDGHFFSFARDAGVT